MSPLTQSKVLRVLQEQRFERLGGNETVRTDVRVLAASNRDLGALVARGQFRQDLYYRLSGYTIRLPPLRERGDDLALLVQHYLRRSGRALGKEVKVITPEALEVLVRHAWPGNVRELQNVLERALIEATGPVLLPEFLEPALAQRPAAPPPADAPADDLAPFIEERLRAGSEDLYAETLRRMERLLLTRVLEHTGGNQLKAAQLLGITRGSLRTKLRDLGITIARHVARPEAAD